MPERGWGREFNEPILLPRGRYLATLRDAAEHITEHVAPEWQAAIEALMLVVKHNGPTMFARIGMMRALNRHVEQAIDPSRKGTHWGKRKLARDK